MRPRSIFAIATALLAACVGGGRTPGERGDQLPADGAAGSVRSEGADIHYRVYGAGPALLVLNGGFGRDSSGFESLAKPLSATHQVILCDPRGTGRSALPTVNSENVTLALMLEDIEAIRRALGHDSWSVLGHSFGGMVACAYTAAHPDRVDRLVLSSSSGIDRSLFEGDARGFIQARLTQGDREALLAMEEAYEAGDSSDDLKRRFAEVLARAYVVDDDKSPWVQARLQSGNDAVAKLLTADLSRTDFDCKPQLRGFERPVLIIHGEQDVFPLAISELAQQTFPSAELFVLPRAGHYGWIDRPAAYFAKVTEFLAVGAPPARR